MGYYGFNRQHMDFVFLEYIGDLFAPVASPEATNAQALKQTGAELEAVGKWAGRLLFFLGIQAVGIGLWWWAYTAAVVPALSPMAARVGVSGECLALCVFNRWGAGFHPLGPYGIRIAHIGSTVYYTLAQNPILFASEALRVAWVSRGSMAQRANSRDHAV